MSTTPAEPPVVISTKEELFDFMAKEWARLMRAEQEQEWSNDRLRFYRAGRADRQSDIIGWLRNRAAQLGVGNPESAIIYGLVKLIESRPDGPPPIWVCELCYTTCYGSRLPDSWVLVLQSAICPSCIERSEKGGGLYHLRGGCYSGGRTDPRARSEEATG